MAVTLRGTAVTGSSTTDVTGPTINAPTGIAQDDWWYIAINVQAASGAPTVNTPTGWTSIDSELNNGGISTYLFRKTAIWNSGDATSQAFTFSANASYGYVSFAVIGAHLTTPNGTPASGQDTTSNTTFDMVSLTTTVNGSKEIVVAGIGSNSITFGADGTSGAPGGASAGYTTVGTVGGKRCQVWHKDQATAANLGTMSATPSSNARGNTIRVEIFAASGTSATVDADADNAIADAAGTSPAPVVTGSSAGTVDATGAPADGTGAALPPSVQAGANVTTPAADATGEAPLSGNEVSSDVGAVPAAAAGDVPAPTVTGSTPDATVDLDAADATADAAADAPAPTVTGDGGVTSPAAAGAGAAPAPTVQAGAGVTAPAGAGAGDAPAPAVTGATEVTAPPAAGAGDAPAPTVQAGAAVSAPAATGAGDAPAPVVEGDVFPAPDIVLPTSLELDDLGATSADIDSLGSTSALIAGWTSTGAIDALGESGALVDEDVAASALDETTAGSALDELTGTTALIG
jgi:hypothetical protein